MSLVAAAWRWRRQLGGSKGDSAAVAAAQRQRLRGGCISAAAALVRWRRWRQFGVSKGDSATAVAAQRQHLRGGCISAVAALAQRRR